VEDNGRLIKHEINVGIASVYDERRACWAKQCVYTRRACVSALPFGRDFAKS